jgi:hypothetical protein
MPQEIQCLECFNIFNNQSNKRRKFCSLGCSTAFRNAREANDRRSIYSLRPKLCKNCKNPLSYQASLSNVFCNSRCSSIYNNKIYIKRPRKLKPSPLCKKCSLYPCKMGNSRSYNRLCEHCWEEHCNRKGNRTRNEITRAELGGHARCLLKKHKANMKCDWCLYDKHVECCHIKSIASFPLTAVVNEINAISNLRWLCPNCHWELDRGLQGERI